jgi:hypothetical protein
MNQASCREEFCCSPDRTNRVLEIIVREMGLGYCETNEGGVNQAFILGRSSRADP